MYLLSVLVYKIVYQIFHISQASKQNNLQANVDSIAKVPLEGCEDLKTQGKPTLTFY